MFGALLRPVFHDHELQEILVRASGLDWTIMRPGTFADGRATADFREGFGPAKRGFRLKIPRASVARFLSRQVVETVHHHRAVAISQ